MWKIYKRNIEILVNRKNTELELIFISREALKKNNRLLVKKLKFKIPYQIPFTGDPSSKALPAAMKIYLNGINFYIREGFKNK